MFAWCSQKIGSCAAVWGLPIQPPMATCTLLCGRFSSCPVPGLLPPKLTAGPVYAVCISATEGSQIVALSEPVPLLNGALRLAVKSGFVALAGLGSGSGSTRFDATGSAGVGL